MYIINSIVIIIYYTINIIYLIRLYLQFKVCPELLWCGMQLMMFFGITRNANWEMQSDRELILLYLIGLIVYIISSSFFRIVTNPQKRISAEGDLEKYRVRKPYLYLMMYVSIILSARFYISGGGNVFINGLRALISGYAYSTKYSRMALLSVSGVGYIYQLRVIVLPLCVLYFVMINKKKLSSFLYGILMLVFLVGTGQRGGLVSFFAITLITIYYWFSAKNERNNYSSLKMTRIYFFAIGVALLLFGLSTIMNGRVSEGKSVFSAILQRFLDDNQGSAIMAFRYIKSQDIQYGYDWMMSFLDLLPGKNSYVPLDTRVFAYIYGGSTAGTSPACIWGSGYYNFGIFGVVLIGIFTGMLTTIIHSVFSKKLCDEVDIIGYSSLQFLAAYWVAAGPVTLFNNGFFTTILWCWVLRIAMRYRFVIKGKRRNVGLLR